MGVTAGIFLASILLKEMGYLVYIRYLWAMPAPIFRRVNDKKEIDIYGQYNNLTIIGFVHSRPLPSPPLPSPPLPSPVYFETHSTSPR
jgi:hypothetical protein